MQIGFLPGRGQRHPGLPLAILAAPCRSGLPRCSPVPFACSGPGVSVPVTQVSNVCCLGLCVHSCVSLGRMWPHRGTRMPDAVHRPGATFDPA